MTCNYDITSIIRGLISDMIVPYVYSDSQLSELSIYAAHLLLTEVSFPTDYTVSISQQSITPDYSTDHDFINLTAFKTAIMALQGELKVAAGQAITVTDGPSSISLGGVFKAKKELLSYYLTNYEKMKMLVSMGLGHAVVTPTTNEGVSDYGYTFN